MILFSTKILQSLKMLKLFAYYIVLQKRIFKYYLLFVYLVLGFLGIPTKMYVGFMNFLKILIHIEW